MFQSNPNMIWNAVFFDMTRKSYMNSNTKWEYWSLPVYRFDSFKQIGQVIIYLYNKYTH